MVSTILLWLGATLARGVTNAAVLPLALPNCHPSKHVTRPCQSSQRDSVTTTAHQWEYFPGNQVPVTILGLHQYNGVELPHLGGAGGVHRGGPWSLPGTPPVHGSRLPHQPAAESASSPGAQQLPACGPATEVQVTNRHSS